MELFEIVKKLNGDVRPIGKSEVDEVRFENLKSLCNLTRELLLEIEVCSQEVSAYQASIKKIGVYADDFLNNIKEEF